MAKDKSTVKFKLVKFDEAGPQRGLELTPLDFVRIVEAVERATRYYTPDKHDDLHEGHYKLLQKLRGLL